MDLVAASGILREELKRSFRPARVRILFVVESPPASGGSFTLVIRGFTWPCAKAFQIDEENFLAAFQASGCYLVDLCAEPVDRLEAKARRAACAPGDASLARTIVELQPASAGPFG